MELTPKQEQQRRAIIDLAEKLGSALWDIEQIAGDLSKAMYAIAGTIKTEEEKHPPPLNPDFCWATSGTM